MRTEYLIQAAKLLESSTPLRADCGLLCDHACCRPDEDGQGGVLLFPGERALIGGEWGRFEDGDALLCDKPCDRTRRPLCCRLFPLAPARCKDGAWSVRMDRRAWAMCPLMPQGVKGLDPSFVERARQAVALLSRDPDYEAFLRDWSRNERAFAAQKSL